MRDYLLNLKCVPEKLLCKIILLGVLTLLADWIFYGQRIGWTAGAFSLFIIVSYFSFVSFPKENTAAKNMILILMVGQAFALVEHLNIISFLLMLPGVAALTLLKIEGNGRSVFGYVRFLGVFILRFWVCGIADLITYKTALSRKAKILSSLVHNLMNWAIPIVLSVLFIVIFSFANPIISSWFSAIDMSLLLRIFSFERFFFWAVSLSAIWVVFRPRFILKAIGVCKATTRWRAINSKYLPESMTVRALCLFNLVFLVQTALDVIYLWGGVELPNGLSYATYAHKGAYPLVFTALLSAVFMLAVLRPESNAEKSAFIRKLLYFWIAQNAFLVFSSIWRTVIYVEAYQLTYLRVSALIWMALVALGFLLIMIRLNLKKDNWWLIRANGMSLICVLYVAAFIDFGHIVATYNVRQSYEVNSQGPFLDANYLIEDIGPAALPALYELLDTAKRENLSPYIKSKVSQLVETLNQEEKLSDWRGWTFRHHRLAELIEIKPKE